MRRVSGLMATLLLTMSFAGHASALILFQDDDNHDVNSEGLIINADDTGAQDASLQFGNDATDATITFGDATSDLTIATPSGGDVIVGSGTGLNFSGSDMFRIRENADPATNSACTVKGELIYDTTDDQLQICTVVGGAGAATWAAVDTGGGDAATLDGLDSLDFLRSTASDSFGDGGTFTLTIGADDTLQVDGTFDANGAVTIGDGGDAATLDSTTLSIDSTDTTNLTMTANDAAAKTLTIQATNAGAGAGNLDINVDEAVTIDSTAGGVSLDGAAASNFTTSAGALTLDGNGGVNIAGNAAEVDVTTTGLVDVNSGAFTLDGTTGSLDFTDTANLTMTANDAATKTLTISATNAGAGAGQIVIGTDTWDISGAGVATGFTGVTSTGVIDYSGSSRLALHQGAANPGTCVEGDIFYNTTDNTTYTCTATNTWTALSSGGADTFESVYAADGDKSLSITDNLATGFDIKEGANSYIHLATTNGSELVTITPATTVTGTLTANGTLAANGAVTLGDNGDTVTINSSDWDISATGDITGAGAITADGLITGTAGATVSGAATSINASSNFATNINTGTSSGAVTIGGGSGTVAINSSDWDISATGDITGAGAITADGLITGTAGATLSGAAISLNNSSNFATNVGTGTSTGAVTVGGGSNTVAINSSSWDITTAGAASGLTTIGASGNITTSAGDFIIGTTGLTETTGATDSGAYLVGAFDEFANSASTTVQGVLNDLDALIGSGAPNTDTMVFEPEYPNYILWGDGTSNNGKMEALYDSTNREHYYRWTTKKSAAHDYDIRFRYTLPADYTAAGNMTIRLRTDTTTAGDNSIDVTVRNDTDNGTCHADGATTGAVAGTWETITITGAEVETGCTGGTALNPGDVVEVILKTFANNTSSGGTDVGTLAFAYTN